MRKGGEAKFKIREVENERSRDRRIQRQKHGGRPAANGGSGSHSREFPHTDVALEQMAPATIDLGKDTKVLMKAAGRYHEPP